MKCKFNIFPIWSPLAMLLVIVALAASAHAADLIFPTGSRIGLVPPAGMKPSSTFPGFVGEDKNTGILISALPAGAYDEVEKTLTADTLKKQNLTLEKKEPFQLPSGKGVLAVGTLTGPDNAKYRKWLLLAPMGEITALVAVQVPERSKTYSDSAIRAALASLAVRPVVPTEEFLSLLPFKVGDMAGFHPGNVMPGRALMLIDAPKDPHLVVTQGGGLPEFEFDARFIVAAVPGAPEDTQGRANLAQLAFNTIGGIKDVHITMAEPVRLDNRQGFETVAQAKDAGTGADLMVVQWLRFGNGEFLQMVGISRADIWSSELARLRTIRDSIELK